MSECYTQAERACRVSKVGSNAGRDDAMHPPSQRPPKQHLHPVPSLVRDRLRWRFRFPWMPGLEREGERHVHYKYCKQGREDGQGAPHVSLQSVFRPGCLSPFSHMHDHTEYMSGDKKMCRGCVLPKSTRICICVKYREGEKMYTTPSHIKPRAALVRTSRR